MNGDLEKKKSRSKMNEFSLIFTIVFIIAVFLIIVFVISTSSENQTGVECIEDSDCIKIQTTCCPCEMGGIEKCVPYRQHKLFEPQECSENPVCIALYNCEVKDCLCINKKCTEIIGEKTAED